MILIDRLDHLVLTVRDIDRTIAFYASVLGMEVIEFAGGRKALKFGQQKINLHPAGENWETRNHPAVGSADICLISSSSLEQICECLSRYKIRILEGPVIKSGALGPITSVYFNDPDENLVEVSVY